LDFSSPRCRRGRHARAAARCRARAAGRGRADHRTFAVMAHGAHFIKPDKTKDFEAVMAKLKEALNKSEAWPQGTGEN